MISKHGNFKYDGSIPFFVGDRRYGQDMIRDHFSQLSHIGSAIEGIVGSDTFLLKGGIVSQGSSVNQINISELFAIIKTSVEIPDSFASIPPTKTSADISIPSYLAAQSDISLSGATLDGVTTNYVKTSYSFVDGNTRQRAKKAGAYAYEGQPSVSISINSTAPTAYELQLATLVGDGSTFLTIAGIEYFFNLNQLELNIIKPNKILEKETGSGVSFDSALSEDAFSIFGNTYTPTPISNLNGESITSVNSSDITYIGNGEIVYKNNSGGGFIFKKSVNNTSNGFAITSAVVASNITYIGNGEIVYKNNSDGFLYKKSVNDSSNGVAITSVSGSDTCYIGNREIIYVGSGNNLYKKSVDDTLTGSVINTANSTNVAYIGDGEIIYRNQDDSFKLYKKSVNDSSNGIAINSVNSETPFYVGNREIIYKNNGGSGYLYKKSVDDTTDGVAINSVSSSDISYIGNGEIVYRNNSDGFLYKKSAVPRLIF